MSRTLVLTVDPAWPPVSGAELRNWQNATALAGLGPVTLASIKPSANTEPSPNSEIAIVGLSEEGEDRRDAYRRRRTSVDEKIPKSAISRLSRLMGEFRPDAVIVEGIGLHPLLPLVRPSTANLVLDMHNIESDLAGQGRATSSPMRRFFFHGFDSDQDRIREAERAAIRIADRVWLCSAQDRKRLEAIAGGPVRSHIVPNGVPHASRFSSPPPPPPSRQGGWPVILFVGHLSYEPNVRAIKRLAERIMPLVRALLPDSRLRIVGRNPAPPVRRLSAGGAFDLIANPDDVSAYLAHAHVVVVPLEFGGGTRLKILEAMAAGVPVVATPLAAEGLDIADGIHIVLGNSDSELAEGVHMLCSDTGRWHRQRETAWKLVMDVYGPAAIARSVRDGLEPS